MKPLQQKPFLSIIKSIDMMVTKTIKQKGVTPMSTVTFHIFPKELETLKKDLEELGNPSISFHSMLTLDMEPVLTKKQETKQNPAFVLMKTDRFQDIQQGNGQCIDFVNGRSEAALVIYDNYDFDSTINWSKEVVSEYLFTHVLNEENSLYFFLIPIR